MDSRRRRPEDYVPVELKRDLYLVTEIEGADGRRHRINHLVGGRDASVHKE